jgi:phage terminase Nu1 subunit (DNA packaging protein)
MVEELSVNLSEIARILGVSDRTVQRWHEAGIPRHGEGRGSTYPVARVVAWVRRRDREQFERELAMSPAPDLDEARARKENALARLRELDVAEREGELITVEDALAHQEQVYAALRGILLAVPGKYAHTFVGLRSHAEGQRKLEDIIFETMTAMVDWSDDAEAAELAELDASTAEAA